MHLWGGESGKGSNMELSQPGKVLGAELCPPGIHIKVLTPQYLRM